jgi:hypothetical protein
MQRETYPVCCNYICHCENLEIQSAGINEGKLTGV